MKPKSTLRAFLAMAGSTLLTITYASADTYYWDSDGAGTPGFGSAAGTWDAAGTGNLWSTNSSGSEDLVGPPPSGPVADYATTTSDNLYFGTPTNAFTGVITINGTVNANYIYQCATATNLAGTTPTINFSAEGTFENDKENWAIAAGTSITGAGTSIRWKSKRNTSIVNITSSTAAKTILSTSDTTVYPYPGRTEMNAAAQLGATGAELVFDKGTLRMSSGFPYSSLSTLDAAHPVTFTADKDAGFENTTGATFTHDMVINLGTGIYWAEGGVVKLTQNNTWGGVNLTGGTLEIENQNQLGPLASPLRFGSGDPLYLSNGILRIVGTSMTSLGSRSMLTTTNKGVSFDIADAANTFTVDQLLNQGTGAFTKAGAGSLIINTTSTYTGLTTVSGGTLSYATDAGLPTGAVTVNGAGAVLDFGAYNPSVTTVTLQNGSVTGSGILTGTSFVLSGVSPAVMNIPVKLAGASATLTKNNTGTATLSGNNSALGGNVTISNGILNINSTTALGTGTVTISGGTIDAASGPITLSTNNSITLGGNFAFGGTNNLTFGTGPITMAAGRTITLNGTGSTLTFPGVLTHTNTGNSTLAANGAGNTLKLGDIELSNTSNNRTLTISGTGNTVVDGAITNGTAGATACALTKTGTGTLTLNGDNTYDGLTTHSIAGSTLTLAGDNSGAAGGLTMNNATAVLNINSATALGTGTTTLTAGTFDNTSGSPKTTSGTTAVTLAGNTIWGGSYDLTLGGPVNQSASRIITLNGSATLTFDNLINSNAGNSALTVTGAGKTLKANSLACSNSGTLRTFTVQGDGNLTITGAVSGSSLGGSEGIASILIKSGTGTLTLQGTNTYTGNTTVNTDGTLALVGGSQDSAITVATGGSLGFELGSPTTSTKAVNLTNGQVTISNPGAVDNSSDYLLMTAAGGFTFTDPLTQLGTAITDYALQRKNGNTELWLVYTAGGSPFQTWALAKGLDGTAGKENGEADDPDGDGKNNKFEFAFNGDPLSGSDNGMIAGLVQDASAPAGNELTLVVAVRNGATFSSSGTPTVQTATVDGVTYTIEGTLDLVTIPGSDVSQAAGPSDTAPLATGLPSLTGTDWEYHTFKLDASEGLGSKGFLRAKAE